ncbi:MAG: Type 1 glutamine amidotransferase-like domain-containing protein [Anaerolineales bacterium]
MLALVGSGEYLPPMEAVDRLLLQRLPSPARVVCLPTAAGTEGPGRTGYWARLAVEHFTRLGVSVRSLPVIDVAGANDPAFAAAVAEANFVYLSGGHPDYLYRTLRGSLVWQAIFSVREKGGLLAGCSAGAMVMGEVLFGIPPWRRLSGFGLLPGAMVIPHFDEFPQWASMMLHLLAGRGLTTVGIEANTALFVQDGKMEVIGSGGVMVWNRAVRKRYTQGSLPSWRPS